MRDIYASEIGVLAAALHTIQGECKNHAGCHECPFSLGIASEQSTVIVKCGIRFCDPEKWEINDDMNWRAFK